MCKFLSNLQLVYLHSSHRRQHRRHPDPHHRAAADQRGSGPYPDHPLAPCNRDQIRKLKTEHFNRNRYSSQCCRACPFLTDARFFFFFFFWAGCSFYPFTFFFDNITSVLQSRSICFGGSVLFPRLQSKFILFASKAVLRIRNYLFYSRSGSIFEFSEFRIRIQPILKYIFINNTKTHLKFNQKEEYRY